MSTTRRRTALVVLSSMAALGVLFVAIFTALGSLAPSQSATINTSLNPQALPEFEVSPTSKRGFFCTEEGTLPAAVATPNGRYPLIDVYSVDEVIDLRGFTEPNTLVILTNDCQPITDIVSFLQPTRTQDVGTPFAPRWFEPAASDLNSTWFTSITESGDVALRSTPLFTYDPATHPSLPTVAFLINAPGVAQPPSVRLNTLSATSSVQQLTIQLPSGATYE